MRAPTQHRGAPRTLAGGVRVLVRLSIAVGLVLLVLNVAPRAVMLVHLQPRTVALQDASRELGVVAAATADLRAAVYADAAATGADASGGAPAVAVTRADARERADSAASAAASSRLLDASLRAQMAEVELLRDRWVERWADAASLGTPAAGEGDLASYLAAHDALARALTLELERSSDAERRWLLWSGVLQGVIAMTAVALGFAAIHRAVVEVTRPVEHLVATVRRVAEGDLSTGPAPIDGPAELVELGRHIGEMTTALRTQQLRATAREERARSEAVTDALTGLRNRRALDADLAAELEQAARSGLPVAVITADLDFFKAVNDRHGHACGDDVLRRTSDVLRAGVRGPDLVYRAGGEEFVVLCPGTTATAAAAVAERLRAALAAAADGLPRTTASFGVADDAGRAGEHATVGARAAALLASADMALYAAKRRGRDRVVVAGSRPAVPAAAVASARA